MVDRATKVGETLRQGLSIAGTLFVLTVTVFSLIWSLDPPWSVNELQGSLVSWGKQEGRTAPLKQYKMHLVVKADDGRIIGVSSERVVPPTVADRILMQERVGLLGTRSFVEIRAR